jgi:hypothetical protein
MEFPKTAKEKDRICNEEVFRIFEELRKKYSKDNNRGLDIVLNSLYGIEQNRGLMQDTWTLN